MRWVLAVFLLVVLVILDQARFRGHYSAELNRTMQSAITSMIR